MAIASANARPMNMLIRINGSASGLRPIALKADPAAIPIPRPGPIAPKPIASAIASEVTLKTSFKENPLMYCLMLMYAIAEKLRVASIGTNECSILADCHSLFFCLAFPILLECLLFRLIPNFLVAGSANFQEDECQQSENKRLYKTHKEFSWDENSIRNKGEKPCENR